MFAQITKKRGNINFVTGLGEMVETDEEAWY